MPHGSNKIFTESFPNVTNCGDERFIGEISDGTLIVYRYFDFENTKNISLEINGNADGKLTLSTEINGSPFAEKNINLSGNSQICRVLIPSA